MQVLKVTDVGQDTRMNRGSDCGTITTTSTYATSGFSLAEADSVISTEVENNTSVGYIAFATDCIVRPWPIYGLIGFNLAYFSTNPATTGSFQLNMGTLVIFI